MTQEEQDRLNELMAKAKSGGGNGGGRPGGGGGSDDDIRVEGELNDFSLIDSGTIVLAYLDKEKTEIIQTRNKQKMIKAMWRVAEGQPHANRCIFDNYMLEGKGNSRFLELADAHGYYDKSAKRANCKLSDLVGPTKLAWIELHVEPERKEIDPDTQIETGRVFPARNIIRPFGGITAKASRPVNGAQPAAPSTPTSAAPVTPAIAAPQATPASGDRSKPSWGTDPDED